MSIHCASHLTALITGELPLALPIPPLDIGTQAVNPESARTNAVQR